MTDRYGDPFRAFYDRALPAVYGYMRTRLSDLSRVEDVTQEVFMAAVKQWPFPANVRDEVAFVMGIARHKLVDEYRRQDAQVRRRQQYAAMSGHAAAHRTTAANEVRVQWALASVPAMQRAALVLRHVDDLAVKDVAAVLGKSVRATESLLARGTRSLRKSFREVEKTDV
ncbi:MAG: RNA polymerase sigma factor [Acidimicrobiia bacterium]|nr:RNA polymerase sigma factor [Acidimicrobiia bacterium]